MAQNSPNSLGLYKHRVMTCRDLYSHCIYKFRVSYLKSYNDVEDD